MVCTFFFISFYLCPLQDVDAVEEDVLDAAPEVLLVAQEDLVEVAEAAHQDAEVNVQLVVGTWDLHPEKEKKKKKREKEK